MSDVRLIRNLSLATLISLILLMASPLRLDSAMPAGDQPGYGGTLVVGINSDIDTFNPLFSESVTARELTHLIHLGLADLSERSEFVPELARKWRSSRDHKKLIYFLRKDARWSDGTPVTAEDVKFTFDLLMDSTVASPNAYVTDFIDRVVIEDAHTVVFEFNHAYPDQIFDTAGEILPKHRLERADRSTLRSNTYGRMPLSSGPFVVKKWVSQQYIELEANRKYFGGRPYLDRIVFKIVPDQTNLLLQLQTGEVDMVLGVPPAEVERLEQANPNLRIYPVSGRVYYYVGYNETNPRFANAQVRRALTMAIDRRKMIQALLFGYGKPCLGPLPPMIAWAYNDDVREIPYDPASARKLLAEAGWTDHNGDGVIDKDGLEFKLTVITNAGNTTKADAAVVIQQQLKKVGVDVQIQLLEWTTYLDKLRSKDFDAHIGGWSSSFNIDPTPIFHSSAKDHLFNYISYANPKVDTLIEQGREEMNRTKAAEIWKDMQARVYADQPYTFLFWIDKIVAVNAQFRNVSPTPVSSFSGLEKWYKAGLVSD